MSLAGSKGVRAMYYSFGDIICPICGEVMNQTVRGWMCPDCLTEHIICNNIDEEEAENGR